ncbi:MAG: glucuronate isomerase [Limnochordales bacterium]|nr:glucuronate isomerase [Limnochordales bacterium]
MDAAVHTGASPLTSVSELRSFVRQTVEKTPVTDIHTHLYPPDSPQLLFGIDELLSYHYLIAEALRVSDLPYETFWELPRRKQADFIWATLFVNRSPVSEACRGVLTTLAGLGLDVSRRDLEGYRTALADLSITEYVDRVLAVANVRYVVMTNDPFDPTERAYWLSAGRGARDPRFLAALRLDPLLLAWPRVVPQLVVAGYRVRTGETGLDAQTLGEIRRFLADWIERLEPVYLAVSLPPEFAYPDHSGKEEAIRTQLIEEAVLPSARQYGLPLALMIGVKRQVNPALRVAGDGVGKAAISAVEHLCASFPENKFMVTMLSRENQHELAVVARKFRNLLPFGCWWFLNNPSLVTEITRMRMELLGTSFVPQHSDARVLDQLIYKWAHARAIIAEVLSHQYELLLATGWQPTRSEVERDVEALLGGYFWEFTGRRPGADRQDAR